MSQGASSPGDAGAGEDEEAIVALRREIAQLREEREKSRALVQRMRSQRDEAQAALRRLGAPFDAPLDEEIAHPTTPAPPPFSVASPPQVPSAPTPPAELRAAPTAAPPRPTSTQAAPTQAAPTQAAPAAPASTAAQSTPTAAPPRARKQESAGSSEPKLKGASPISELHVAADGSRTAPREGSG